MGKDWYLKSLHGELGKILQGSRDFRIRGPDELIPWRGKARNLWPRADLIVDIQDTQILVETDDNSDPCRSIVKYWPYLDEQRNKKIVLLEIWRRGSSIGEGYYELAKLIGTKFEAIFPNFGYISKERHEEPPEQMAQWVLAQIKKFTLGTAPKEIQAQKG